MYVCVQARLQYYAYNFSSYVNNPDPLLWVTGQTFVHATRRLLTFLLRTPCTWSSTFANVPLSTILLNAIERISRQ